MKFSIKHFFSKCDQIHSFLQIWLYLPKKSLMENFIFCAVCLIGQKFFSTIFRSRHHRCFIKKVFLKISQNSQESVCARVSFFNKTAGLMPTTLFKKKTLVLVFMRFLRRTFLQNTSGRLLLYIKPLM